MTTLQAYKHCEITAHEHYENFPVASLFVPKAMRQHLYAIYAFCRMADDIADEGTDSVSNRLAKLSDLRYWLRNSNWDDPVMVALSDTIRTCRLPLEPFDRLLDAFSQDANFKSPTTWEELLFYCTRSANPVGELFLRLAYNGQVPPAEAIQASNHVCTALQITNFLQDLHIDLERGRSYLPVPDAEAVARTRDMFRQGASVTRYVKSWRLKLELWLIIQGGQTMLELCASRVDRLQRPKLSFWTVILRYAKSRVR